MFTHEEKMQLFNRLPSLELSYEPKIHKKVYSAVYYIIPKGPKALVWYTYWKDQHVCLLILLNERGNYSDIKLFPACFSDALALGTLLYGTHFIHHQQPYFTCEQVYYYKGLPLKKTQQPYLEQLNLLLNMFDKEVEQVAYTKNMLVVGLPVITETYEEALDIIEQLPYKTYGIAAPVPINVPLPLPMQVPLLLPVPLPMQVPLPINVPLPMQVPAKTFRHNNNIHKNGERENTQRFNVKAELAADTYSLYSPTEDKRFIGTAMVPTYKSSVFLNGLFRTIKENANLDLLEESDNEDEFENTQLDKFVDLEKILCMECVFLKRFQKWQPVKLIKI